MKKQVTAVGLISVLCATFVFLPQVQSQDRDLVPVLQGLLQKYQGCILERYETTETQNLQPRDDASCVNGNKCSLAFRRSTFGRLQAQANLGDPTNFEAILESAVLNDCFQCQEHRKWHTKHVHCTMDCGGNNGIFKGPCFESCKAGVDITKLVNDVISDIRGVLQSIGIIGPHDTEATGGPSVATNRNIIDPGADESCDPNPDGYYMAPTELLDWTPTSAPSFEKVFTNYDPPSSPNRSQYNSPSLQNIGANEGRLRADLRASAARANPIESLCQAAIAFSRGNTIDGNAFADLSVTGRRSYSGFRSKPPQDQDILPCLQSDPGAQRISDASKQSAVGSALDRAYHVAGVVRAGGWPVKNKARATLGYIAVSGEDDQPDRPVDVPSAEFPQYDLSVSVQRPNKSPLLVHTRYMIAHTVVPSNKTKPNGQTYNDEIENSTNLNRRLPSVAAPILAQDAEIILYIHGMDSRLEEALDLTRAIRRLGRQRGKNYTVISFDMPTSGYADNIDYNQIAPLQADGHADGVDGLGFAPNKYVVPIVDFDENFIVSFVNTLNRSIPVTSHLKAIVGGSLGGNMSMRLGRPRADAPWIKNVVPWSPAAIWPSFADDGTKHAGLAVPWSFAGGDAEFLQETPGARRSFFYGGFDWQSKVAGIIPLGGGKPQAEYWYSDRWRCKSAQMRLSRIDRYETYNKNFRLWHWRLGMEQLLFSQQVPASGTNEPLYLSNTIRMLLMCGMDDIGGDLCLNTREVAPKMSYTPGYALFLKNTGHSIHNERPMFLATKIADFIDSEPQKATPGISEKPEGNANKEAERTTTIVVNITRIGNQAAGNSSRDTLYRYYPKVKIIDGTYIQSTRNDVFTKSASIMDGDVPIRIEIWREISGPERPQPSGRHPQTPSSSELSKVKAEIVRTFDVVYDLRKDIFTVREAASDTFSNKYGSKSSVPFRAGSVAVFASNSDGPEVDFVISDQLNK